ncbi:MAG TPA: hypothetical protein VG944_16955 [Fimbriimonas sp.]|nr:hypothetical protein [Fimbriimonas sp.]
MRSPAAWLSNLATRRQDRRAAEHREQTKALHLTSLTPEARSRFGRLEMLLASIVKKVENGQVSYREVVRKLDYLLEQFLLLGVKQVEFAEYLDSLRKDRGVLPPSTQKSPGVPSARLIADEQGARQVIAAICGSYRQEILSLEEEGKTEANPHNRALLEKRRELLHRRREYASQIGDIVFNIGHQLKLMDDTFGLINDEIRARSPEQVLNEIDELVSQTDRLTERLQEVEPFESAQP